MQISTPHASVYATKHSLKKMVNSPHYSSQFLRCSFLFREFSHAVGRFGSGLASTVFFLNSSLHEFPLSPRLFSVVAFSRHSHRKHFLHLLTKHRQSKLAPQVGVDRSLQSSLTMRRSERGARTPSALFRRWRHDSPHQFLTIYVSREKSQEAFFNPTPDRLGRLIPNELPNAVLIVS